MKRIVTVLTLVMMFTILTGCTAPSGNVGEQSKISQYLSEVNGVYKLTLPKSKKEIILDKDEVKFVPYVTDALIEAAENKITKDISQYSNNSDFYLDVIDDYLCLSVEVIKKIDPPASDGEYTYGGCGYDHEHLFFNERISTQIIKNSDKVVINNAPVGIAHYIDIKSGETIICPFDCMLWAKIDNGDGTFSEALVDKYDVVDLVSGKTNLSVTDIIPKLVLNESLSYSVQANGRVEKVYFITSNGDNYTKTETEFDALSYLPNGTYYVVLEVLISGNCDPDAPQNSYLYEDVFCLIVEDDNQ